MGRKGFLILVIFFSLQLVSCSHSIHLVHLSGFDPRVKKGTGKMIEARAEQFTIMGFTMDTNYVEQARESLMNQCANGQIEGISTQFSTSHGFFSWRNKILMKGICIGKA